MADTKQAYRLENIRETLKLLEGHLEKNYEDANQLDDKAKTLIGGVGLLAALLAGFQPIKLSQPPSVIYLLLLVAGAFTLIVTVFSAIVVLSPEKYARPMKADWDTVSSFWYLDSYDLLAKLTSAYVAAIEANLEVLARKSRALIISASAFVTTLIILIILVVLPR